MGWLSGRRGGSPHITGGSPRFGKRKARGKGNAQDQRLVPRTPVARGTNQEIAVERQSRATVQPALLVTGAKCAPLVVDPARA